MTLLTGLTTSGAEVTLQVDSEGRLVAEGLPGPAGPAGPAGDVGPQGIAGVAGANGANGLAGPAGAAGPQGPQGEQGVQGEPGPIGPAGSSGTSTSTLAAVTDLVTTATAGTLPVATGSVVIADATAPTLGEVLKYAVEIEAKLETTLSRLRSFGVITANDPNFSSVSLLLHMDGANSSTTFVDTSPIAHTVTAHNGAAITTSNSRFGAGAFLGNGTGSRLVIPSSASLAFGTGEFTIEAFINFIPTGNAQFIFSQRLTGGFSLVVLADNRLSLITPDVNTITEPQISMVQGNWYHVAATRLAGVCRIFVNGLLMGTNSNSENGAQNVSIVGAGSTTSTSSFNGRLDDLRITKGVARYSQSFSPPTEPFLDA